MALKRSRLLAIAICFGAAAADVWAQQLGQIPVVGVLMVTAGPLDGPAQALRKGLGQLGYVESQNIRIEYRSAGGQADRLGPLARELAGMKVNVIVTGTEPATRAAQHATDTIPIVAVLSDHDPVASGLVNSLSRPGSNITGVFTRQSELVGKRLELLKEALPKLSRAAVFWDTYSERQFHELEQPGSSLGVQIQGIELRAPYDFKAALQIARKRRQAR